MKISKDISTLGYGIPINYALFILIGFFALIINVGLNNEIMLVILLILSLQFNSVDNNINNNKLLLESHVFSIKIFKKIFTKKIL